MKAKPKAKQTGKPKAERAGTVRGAHCADGLPPVPCVERLRRVCEILQCDFSVALNSCDNDILTRGNVADGLCEIINCGVSFSDCDIDVELRRIAPLAIAERNEKLNAHFGVHRDAEKITESDIDEFIKDFGAERTSLALVRVFGDLAGTEIKYIDDPNEIRARKTAYIVEHNTRELRRTIGQWLYYSRAESVADLSGELRRKCCAKDWQNEMIDLVDNFVTVPMLRDLAFIANAESRRMDKSHAAADRKPDTADGKPSGGESETPARVAGDWATAQGVKNYNGECFSFKGLCLERKPKRAKQWADIAAVIESTEPDGAAMLGKNWRGKFSNADDEYKSFTRFIHPLPERGAGWFRLEKEKIAERRKW